MGDSGGGHEPTCGRAGVRAGDDGKPAPNGTKDITAFGVGGTAPLDQLT